VRNILRCSTASVFSHLKNGNLSHAQNARHGYYKEVGFIVSDAAAALCPQEAIFNILLELFYVAAVINCKNAELCVILHISNHLSFNKEKLHLNQHLCFLLVNVSMVIKNYKMIQNWSLNI